MICSAKEIEHGLTKPDHPWSHEDKKTARGTVFPNGGQLKRMNRAIKEATVKGYFYDDHEQLRRHLHSRPKAQTAQRPQASTVHLERMAGQAGSFH